MGRYDNLNFNNGVRIDQYAGSPIQEIADTASQLSGRHYGNIAQLNQIQLLREQMKSKALPGAKTYFEMAQNGGENSTSKVSFLANKFLGDQGVLASQQHAAEYQKFLDSQKTLKAQGKNPIYNKALEQSYLNAPVVDPSTKQLHDLYSNPFKLNAEPYIEPVPIIDELWKPITPSSMESTLGQRDYLMLSKLMPQVMDANGMVDMPLFYEMTKRQGISEQTIKKFTNAVKRQYMSSDAGKQLSELGEANGTISDGQLNDLVLQRGLMRVFSNVDRQVVQNGLGDDFTRAALKGRANQSNTDGEVYIPLPAETTAGFNVEDDFDVTDIKGGKVESSLTDETINLLGNEVIVASNFGKLFTPTTNEYERDIIWRAGLDYNTNSLSEINQKKTKRAIELMKTAASVYGDGILDNMDMDDQKAQELLKTPKGLALLDKYKKEYGSARYHLPYIGLIPDKSDLELNDEWIKRTIESREVMDQNGNYYSQLRKDDEVNDDLKNLSKAINENKVEYLGTTDPKHIFTDKGGDNFTRAVVVKDLENDKIYYLGQPMGKTEQSDINTNVLYKKATYIKGAWNKLDDKYEVIIPVGKTADELWGKYGLPASVQDTRVTEESFKDGNHILIRDDNDNVILAPNYDKAGKALADMGIKLSNKLD
jgi:hypothetical protein